MHFQLVSRRLFMGVFVSMATVGRAWAQRVSIDDYGYEGSLAAGPIQGFFGLLFFVVFVLLCLPRGSTREFLSALMWLVFWCGAFVFSVQFGVVGPIITVATLGFWLNWQLDPARRAHRTPSAPSPKAEKQASHHTRVSERQPAIDAKKMEREKGEEEQAQRIEQERRRAEADARALAFHESKQKVEQHQQQEIHRKVQREHEAHELRVRAELAAQALAREQQEQRDAEVRRQWEQAQRAERARVRYKDDRNDDEPQRRPRPAQVAPPAPNAPEPVRPTPSVQSSDDGGMPTLRSDQWRLKGDTLLCLASGESFERSSYRVEDGFYVVSSSRHKGRIRISEVADLIRRQK